jgi:hypothetical protein
MRALAMANADNKPNSKQQPKPEPRRDKKQYELLKKCSIEEDMAEWNEYRDTHKDEEIWLEDAKLWRANLEGANLQAAHLQAADLGGANLQHADLRGASLEHAHLMEAHLEGAHLQAAHLQGADLRLASLEGAWLWGANLKGAKLMEANLEGTRFWTAHLGNADFSTAIVNGETLIDETCKVDHDTKFQAVALGNMRIYPSTRQLLEHNVRRIRRWYLKFWARSSVE